MVQFPTLDRLIVRNYGLYPGGRKAEGLDLAFSRGPWIVLGVNGLGKSTLLLLIKHMLSGPATVRPAGFSGERKSDLLSLDKHFFAHRVLDGAEDALATLTVRFGKSSLHIERSLSDLKILACTATIDGAHVAVSTEEDYRSLLPQLMNLASFDDAVRVMDRITFYLESRQPLIWDTAAQFELFRALLTPTISSQLRALEGQIVSNDSTARNLNAALFKLMERRDKEITKRKGAADTQARLAKATAELEILRNSETSLQNELDRADQRRMDARIELKRSEALTDRAAQEYEQVKFDALRHAFAGVTPNEQYVFLKLISDRICLACGSHAEDTAIELERRRDKNLCLVCGSPRLKGITHTSKGIEAKALKSFNALQKSRLESENAKKRFDVSTLEFQKAEQNLEAARRSSDVAEKEVRQLRGKLPDADKNLLAREEDRIENIRREVKNFRRERDEAEQNIEGLLGVLQQATEEIIKGLTHHFNRRVSAFFAQDVRLVYAPRRDRIGQGGRHFEFPAFEVEMTSGATGGQFIRRTAEQVSQSQREYLDIIFRMSFLETLSDSGSTLVVDGPEGALDAVFAERAGALFDSFTRRRPATSVMLACNVVEGGFIPNTLRSFLTMRDRVSRVFNLIDLGTPTATLEELATEYRRKVSSILRQSVGP